jgi:hypothetical protein
MVQAIVPVMATVIKAGLTDAAGLRVRPLAAEDLDEADRTYGSFVIDDWR